MKKNTFVFVVCGDQHAARLNTALGFLKHFSRSNLLVIKSRTKRAVNCDHIDVKVPAKFNNRQAGIFLKTSLHRILKNCAGTFCYLDNDVIAVNSDVDLIFSHARPPVSFAADHCSLRVFSRHAVNCRCTAPECDHLRAAIQKQFGVKVAPKDWRQWNGGVFVFDHGSAEFMERWHQNTLAILDNPYWQPRDQGSLVATVWQLGLQKHPTLPPEFNFIVDPLDGVPHARRDTIRADELKLNESYSLTAGTSKPRPSFLHFINNGVGRRGWKNWDDVANLLKPASPPPAAVVKETVKLKSAPKLLSADNRVVHGLWVGKKLSRLELLTLRSFIHHGHEFHLWVYDDLETQLPKEVIIEDANEIIPRSGLIRKAGTDPETGVGKGSYSSPFSDLFRYKLLYEKGGYWVDMDVTCLRPFDFKVPYVFRPHRVGVVGNIMKCPPRSRLMKLVYEKVARQASEHSEWLMANRVLSKTIRQLKLTRHIQTGIWNEESWWDAVRPFALGDGQIPSDWYAIHWINEFWRVLKEDGGFYRGRRLLEVVPDKDNPAPGSVLARLYAEHQVAGQEIKTVPTVKPPLEIPLNKPAERQPATPQFISANHINILLPSLARGGAEKIVLETLTGLQRRNASAKLFVLHNIRPSYAFEPAGNMRIHRLFAQEMAAKLHQVAAEVLSSPEPVLFTHMVKADLLRQLWRRGVQTVPVIHNARQSWQDSPSAFNHPNVPFIVAVSEAIAEELREDGCRKRIVVVRHESQRWFEAVEQQESRRQIRERLGIGDNTLVIGMIGAFKAQKCYTRAVRVLAQIRQSRPAKLMILGGWDHDWGFGRQAYTAVQRLALELNVTTDLLTPGPVSDAEKYFGAFDVFLNTSSYEGLSVALLEAINSGCPIVTADAGGNREVLPERAVLVKDSSNIAGYVDGIMKCLQTPARVLVQKPADFDLVPQLWRHLGQQSSRAISNPAQQRDGVLFLTDNLNIGGAQRSLVNLLCGLPQPAKAWLGVLEPVYCQSFFDTIERSGVPVVSMRDGRDYLDRLERILHMIDRLNVRSVCFWNVDARLKLLLAKILPKDAVRLVDVSPGPFMFLEMENVRPFQRRIAFSAVDYWKRLDTFVAKYKDKEAVPPGMPDKRRKVVVIPNGVPLPTSAGTAAPLPANADPDLIIGTACRITPGKRIELLMDTMTELNQRLDGVNLVIVGGVDPRHADYWTFLMEHLKSKNLANIHFAGPHPDVTPFLARFKVFVMIAGHPGCPNASLEAMAMGIPVVANLAAGTAGQIAHGKNGFLFRGNDPKEMADHVRYLLVNRKARQQFGTAARAAVKKDFSMTAMIRRYCKLLGIPGK